MRNAPNQLPLSNSPFDGIRRRLSVALMSLMGSSAVAGCCSTWSLNPDPFEKARHEAVNGCENVRLIVIPEAKATILLARYEEADDDDDGLDLKASASLDFSIGGDDDEKKDKAEDKDKTEKNEEEEDPTMKKIRLQAESLREAAEELGPNATMDQLNRRASEIYMRKVAKERGKGKGDEAQRREEERKRREAEKNSPKAQMEMIEARLQLEPNSPLRERVSYTRTYKLSEEDLPWTALVIEPGGRITLRMKGNFIAVEFKCVEDAPTCSGEEMTDPMVLAQEDRGPQRHEGPLSEQDSEKPKAKPSPTQEPATTSTPQTPSTPAQPQTPSMPDRIFGPNGAANYTADPSIQCMIDALTPTLQTHTAETLAGIARTLARGKKWAPEVEDIIDDVVNDTQASDLKKGNIVTAIRFLLVAKSESIPNLARALRVALPDTCGTPAQTTPAQPSPNEAPEDTVALSLNRTRFLQNVNRLRAQSGLDPVRWGTCAQNAATLWANNETAQATVEHNAGGSTPAKRREQLGCSENGMENVAMLSRVSADYAFKRWEDSDSHRAEMLAPALKRIGLHCVRSPKVGTQTKSKNPGKNFCVMTGTTDND